VKKSSNLDLVRSLFAAWEHGDYFTSADWAHPDIEFVVAGGPSPGSWTGRSGMAEGWRDILSVFTEHRSEAEDYRELDDERVLVLLQVSARGRTSGLEVGQIGTTSAALFHIRSGAVTRLVIYWDRERALADLGLAT
jgi:ketosteroid isomerase-like protein